MTEQLPEVIIRKILYATDLSESAQHALAYAVDLANRYNAQLLFLHVMDEVPQDVDKWVVGYLDANKWDQIKQRNVEETEDLLARKKRGKGVYQDVLDSVRQKHRPEGQGETPEDEVVIRRGNPAEKILETAAEKECDMIIMGSHGHGTFMGTMLGSVAKRVVKRSSKPVLVVRLPDDHD